MRYTKTTTHLPRTFGSLLFTGAAATAIALAPHSVANPPPPPPPCFNADGTPCYVGPDGAAGAIPGGPGGVAGPGGAAGAIPGGPVGEAGPGGASGAIPGGPSGAAGPEGATGAIPGGPSGTAGPGGASGCIPGLGCAYIPAP